MEDLSKVSTEELMARWEPAVNAWRFAQTAELKEEWTDILNQYADELDARLDPDGIDNED